MKQGVNAFLRGLQLINMPFEAAAGASEAARQGGAPLGFLGEVPGLGFVPGLISTLTPGVTESGRRAGITPEMSVKERFQRLGQFQRERDPRFPGEKFIGETITSAPTFLLGTGLSPLRAAPRVAKATGLGKVPGVTKGAEAVRAADVGYHRVP